MSGYRLPSPRAFVLGHPVAHSRSPMLHGYWLRSLRVPGAYDLQDVPPGSLGAFFAAMRYRGYVGGNVTVPHKVAVMDFVDRLDETAREIGAVNTIWIEDDELVGGNTDALGAIANLDDRAPGWDVHASNAVMLGAGGAARAATYGLLQRGLQVQIVNRTVEHALDIAQHFGPRVTAHALDALPELLPGADLLINTSSLGMTGKPALPINLDRLNRAAVVCDIVYVPAGNAAADGRGGARTPHRSRAGNAAAPGRCRLRPLVRRHTLRHAGIAGADRGRYPC